MADKDPRISQVVPRCPGPGWLDIARSDEKRPPAFMLEDSYQYLGSDALAASRYTSPEFFAREVAKMWPNVWQFAARDEEMPDPGDYVVYGNAGRSFLLVRQQDGSVKAFHNVCLHRGRKLARKSGHGTKFVCPFHAFAWNTDGSINTIPCRWDFSHLTDEKMQLPEAQVGHWGGYIFVKDNPGGPTLEEYLAPIPEHFKQWKHEECVTVAWVAKVVGANWKVTMEAFMESYHVLATHPQILPFIGDANAANFVWGDNVNANFSSFGTISPHLDSRDKTEQWIMDEHARCNGRSTHDFDQETNASRLTIEAGDTARRALARSARAEAAALYGRDYSETSEAEMLDSLVYNVFPNFAPWAGYQPNIAYRWRPWPDQDRCLMEVRVLMRVKPGEPRPRSVPMHLLGPDEPWSSAAELGLLGNVLQQDVDNMEMVQEGLKVSKNGQIELGDYQEVRIRHFHRTLDGYLAR